MISLLVFLKFGHPVFKVRLGSVSTGSTVMTVPETTMNEDNFLLFGENNVWFALQLRIMQPIPAKAKFPDKFS